MVDKFINYSENVETLNEAFAFVMEYVDQFQAPSIDITAYEQYHDISTLTEGSDVVKNVRYGVSVSGTVS